MTVMTTELSVRFRAVLVPTPESRRRPRRSRKPHDGSIPLDCRVSQRPNFFAVRSQFGHWEGDLLIFRRDLGEANVTSLVERKSRYTVMIKYGSRHRKCLRYRTPAEEFMANSSLLHLDWILQTMHDDWRVRRNVRYGTPPPT